ncbi:MAG: Nucleotidyltransferase domain protein [Candidatus Bathyarchaeota archaeon BA2]|nr:MAG: Nucleotidyltransferase domain protein [Candidatus Bathyarchaeota archaeon BA2]
MGESGVKEAWLKRPELKTFLDTILKEFAPVSVILYGSTSVGGEGAWSDIDILVISEKFSGMKPHEKIGALLEFKAGRVEALGYTPEEFLSMVKKMNPLALDAAVRGLPLYGEGFFNKARELVKQLKIEKRGKMWIKKEQ